MFDESSELSVYDRVAPDYPYTICPDIIAVAYFSPTITESSIAHLTAPLRHAAHCSQFFSASVA